MRVMILSLGVLSLVGATIPASAQIFQECLSTGAPISSTLPPVVEVMAPAVDEVVLAREIFERLLDGESWASFGRIAAEADLHRAGS